MYYKSPGADHKPPAMLRRRLKTGSNSKRYTDPRRGPSLEVTRSQAPPRGLAHGTAFDIVGEGRADIGAFEHALQIATRLAAARLH